MTAFNDDSREHIRYSVDRWYFGGDLGVGGCALTCESCKTEIVDCGAVDDLGEMVLLHEHQSHDASSPALPSTPTWHDNPDEGIPTRDTYRRLRWHVLSSHSIDDPGTNRGDYRWRWRARSNAYALRRYSQTGTRVWIEQRVTPKPQRPAPIEEISL